MTTAHVLVIDNEEPIRRLLGSSLGERGYRVTAVATGDAGLDIAAADPPDVVVLDLGLPNMDSLEVCRQIRAWSNVPILVLLAHDDEMEKVQALDLGADDYLTKPFGTQELLARVRVALRRSEHRPSTQGGMTIGDLRIDLAQRQVLVTGAEVRLTPTEYTLLVELATNAGRVLTHQWLLQHVWGEECGGTVQNLHVCISQLRRKIEAQPARPRYILTEPRIGYRFAPS